MTFSAAVTEVLRDEVARTSQHAVARRLAVWQGDVRHWITGTDERPTPGSKYTMLDAVVATFGLAAIVRHLGPDAAIALYGACVECHERPRAMRGLLRRCSRCRRTGSSAAGSEVPS